MNYCAEMREIYLQIPADEGSNPSRLILSYSKSNLKRQAWKASMGKGELYDAVQSVYEGLNRHRGDIDRNLALDLAREVVPRGIEPSLVVDRVERVYASELAGRGYRES